MPRPLEPGEILRNRYVIRQVIGHGGMGSIYLSEDNRLPGRVCALKEVEQDVSIPDDLRAQGREQFYREASVLARLDHPNLPKVSDFFSEGQRDYLVMDFVPGEDLKTLMDRSRRKGEFLPLDDVLAWADQLCQALEFLHSQEPPIIHRDIKPSNLKITPSGLLKLVDFGLVKQMVPDEITVTVIQGRGTALYTPLEQYGGDTGHTDPRSDIYALGATLYHLITNRPPTEAKHRFLRPDSLIAPSEIHPKVDPHVEAAILWAMSLHPDNRPQDMRTFRQALRAGRSFEIPTRPSEVPATLDALLPTSLDRGLALAAAILLVIATVASIR